MNEMVTVRNRLNGGVTQVYRKIAEHAVFGKNLEIVPDGTKPTIPLTEIVEKAKPRPKAAEQAPSKEED